MAFWGGAKLFAQVEQQGIVTPFDPSKIDCSAYTLTLGAEAFVTPSHGDDLRKNLKQALVAPTAEIISGERRLSGGGTVAIPPGQFAYLLTEEVVSIPNDVMGFISLKSKAKFKGLINVSGFHVDPGFKGRLIYSVFNAGPSALHLSRGDNLFLLWLADLDGRVQKPYYKTDVGYSEIPSELVSDVSRETHSLEALSSHLTSISEEFRTIKNVAKGLVAGLGLLVAGLALKPVFWDDAKQSPPSPVEKNGGQLAPPKIPALTVKKGADQTAGGNQSSKGTE